MLNIIKKLGTLNLAPVSPDTDLCVEILSQELPFVIHEFKSGMEHNGWVVPSSWWTESAKICLNGELIYDGKSHPLGVIGYSQPFCGEVTRSELMDHIFTHKDRPNDLVYHCQLYYRLGEKNWGFSMPQDKINSMGSGKYQVRLDTRFEQGTMKVLEYHLPGHSKETIIINAHNCHAGQANDDISGIAVGIEVMKRLSQMKERRYSYRLIIAPEHFGTVFYTAALAKDEIQKIKYGVFIESVGNDNRLALQSSFNGDTEIDIAADHYLQLTEPGYQRTEMRELVGNDETVWEAPGYEIPTISITRFPFDEYHSSSDNIDSINLSNLNDTADALMGIFNILERNIVMDRKFQGLIALSNPKYGLYIEPGTDPSIPSQDDSHSLKWNNLMNRIIRYFDGKTSALDISVKHQLPFNEVIKYIHKFREKGLIETREI